MLLARDGKLSLDADIRTYLPELPDYGHRITLRHLLTHTSGLRDQWDLLALARGRFEEDRITEADVLDIVTRQKSLNFVPGTEYLYSNTGYTLAGIIVGRVSGKSLRQFADERIFKPLGMTHTHFHDDYTMLVKGRTSAYETGQGRQWHVEHPELRHVRRDEPVHDRRRSAQVAGELSTPGRGRRRHVCARCRRVPCSRTATRPGTGSGSRWASSAGLRARRSLRCRRRLSLVHGPISGTRVRGRRAVQRGPRIRPISPRGVSSDLPEGRSQATPRSGRRDREADGAGARAVRRGVRQQTTGDRRSSRSRNRTLVVGRTGGPALVPLAENRFWLAPARRVGVRA